MSSTSSPSFGARKRSTASLGVSPSSGVTPTVCAIALGTCSAFAVAASETNHPPSRNSGSSPRATSSASRVLPTPPGPISETSRTSVRRSSCETASRSSSRPSVRVGGTGSRLAGTSAVFTAGVASAGSCARMARSSSRKRSPGSIPSSSTSVLRASW